MKAQSSVEFIMNYSWMLAIVGIVMGVLFALGFFNHATWGLGSGSSGFGNLAPMDSGWKLEENGDFITRFRNVAGADLKLWNVEVRVDDITKTYDYSGKTIVSGEDSDTITISGFENRTEGSEYNAFLTLNFGTSDINFTAEGKVWGAVGK